MKILITFFLILISYAVKSQTFLYSYTDPCTGLQKSLTVPSNGVTVTYFGQIQTFNPNDFQNGVFDQWASGVLSSYGNSNPCGSILGVSTSVDLAQGSAINFISIINNISAVSDMQSAMGGGSLNTMSVIESSKSASSKKDKKENKNNNQSNSNQTTITNNSNQSNNPNNTNNTTNQNSTNSANVPNSGSNSGSGSSNNSGSGNSNNGNGENGENENNSGGEAGQINNSQSSQSGNTQNTPSNSGQINQSGGEGGQITTGQNTGGEGGSINPLGQTSQTLTQSTETNSQSSEQSNNQNSNQTGTNTNSENSNSQNQSGGETSQSSEQTNSENQTGGENSTSNSSNSSSTGSNGGNGGNGGNSNENPPNSETSAETTEDKKTNVLGGTVKSSERATETNKPQIVLSSDFAGFNFRDKEVSFGGKGTAGWTSMRWDGKRSYGVLLDYTSIIRGPNVTAFWANMAKRRIDLISATATISFYGRGSQYGTLAVGQMWSFPKVKNLKAIYLATGSFGNVYGEKFLGTAMIAGGMYDWKVSKRIDVKMMNLFIYAPYVSYYNDILLKSPYVIMPIIGTNIGITKKFKFNVNFGGAYAIKQNVMNFTLMFGTRLAI
jgi:hypothetical protein